MEFDEFDEELDEFFPIYDELPIDWDEEGDSDDEFFPSEPIKKRKPTTLEYLERYGFGVE